MAWNKDKQIDADVGLFRSLFPVQTKTPARIVIWSIILLADVVLCVLGAYYLGVLSPENFSKWTVALILAAAVAVFWLQGVICGAIGKRIRRG